MRTIARRLATGALAIGIMAGIGVAAAPLAAQAEPPRKSNTKVITFDNLVDRKITITLCITRSGGKVRSHAVVKWEPTSSIGLDGIFEKFEFNLRTERDDVVKSRHAVFARGPINAESSGEKTYYGDWVTADSATVWTTDATVRYNRDGDGQGDLLWDLTGSPAV
ncbi:hypothetical protein Afil01_30190 [Actinorhabdospora filicis]|uniref:PLAT domain-containing protein n=1 Tax=Actinorhabdospora filicis TaxID=1785913 RepID=A0A9W6SLY3_9ACTN|nr:hypothetical protein [Actinorhabdospora filicis]GLZ78212.1 hypothetical protein Afil01_30190 [Actinorhabdospora filicis]